MTNNTLKPKKLSKMTALQNLLLHTLMMASSELELLTEQKIIELMMKLQNQKLI